MCGGLRGESENGKEVIDVSSAKQVRRGRVKTGVSEESALKTGLLNPGLTW